MTYDELSLSTNHPFVASISSSGLTFWSESIDTWHPSFSLVESIFNFDSFLRLSFLLPLLVTTENEKVLLKVFRNGSMIRSGKKILVGNKPL